MNYYDIGKPSDVAAFVKTVNTARLANKNKWYALTGTVNGKAIKIKGFGTWLQIFDIDGFYYGTCCDIPVKRFKESLANTFNEVLA